MYPNPNNISVQDITVDTLLGYITMRMDTTEFHAAASATPSKNLKQKDRVNIDQKSQLHEILFELYCHTK